MLRYWFEPGNPRLQVAIAPAEAAGTASLTDYLEPEQLAGLAAALTGHLPPSAWSYAEPLVDGHYWLYHRQSVHPQMVEVVGARYRLVGDLGGNPIGQLNQPRWYGPLVPPPLPDR
jgi:hypothetical protein